MGNTSPANSTRRGPTLSGVWYSIVSLLTSLANGFASFAAFRFLLDREPKESILRRFDVAVISRYFPEFERELPRYLARS